MDDPLPLTLGNTIQEETDNSTKSNPKNDSVVLTQPAADAPVTSLVLSTEPLNVEDPIAQEIQEKDDENPPDAPASQFYIFFELLYIQSTFKTVLSALLLFEFCL